MPHPADEHTGARIADYRKLRQLTQTALAQRAFLSRSCIAKVEAGLVPASTAVVAAVARVLQVEVSVLYGQPYVSEMQQDHLDQTVAPLSDALDMYDLGADPDIVPRPLQEIAADIEALCLSSYATEYKSVGGKLPGLLTELTTALASLPPGAEHRRAAGMLAWSYWVAYEFGHRIGYHHLASIALERMGWMADQAQDPLLKAMQLRYRSAALLRHGKISIALKVLERGYKLVEQHEGPEVNGLVVSGSLHLAGGIAAANARSADAVAEHLDAAREAADRIGRDVPLVYWASFGATNVAHFDVATLVELGELGNAVEKAKVLRFPHDHPRMRVGRYHIEMARAYVEMGRTESALKALHLARTVAPQQARYHPFVREAIGTLVRRQRMASEGLASLAAWVGM